jgi:GNAT superfamily N-acetyltransferase
VGTGALIVERKFIHNLGLVGHIEDIAVAKDQQGKKLGLRIIQALDFVAEKVGCYKVRCASPSDRMSTNRMFRQSSTALKQTKASTSSVASRGQAWRWRIIMARTSQKEVSKLFRVGTMTAL